jgi:hypothetical protein
MKIVGTLWVAEASGGCVPCAGHGTACSGFVGELANDGRGGKLYPRKGRWTCYIAGVRRWLFLTAGLRVAGWSPVLLPSITGSISPSTSRMSRAGTPAPLCWHQGRSFGRLPRPVSQPTPRQADCPTTHRIRRRGLRGQVALGLRFDSSNLGGRGGTPFRLTELISEPP